MVEWISGGGMGAVYHGRRLSDGADVALKLLHDERHAARLESEARLLSRLRHPRVARVLDDRSHGARRCLVTELVHGPSLARLLEQRGPLPVAEALEYVRQLCEALAYVHAQQVVHRDVKPANVVLGERGVVLVDFGIARDLRGSGSGGATGAIGTPGFMAPEVLAGGTVSPRTDVFGVAATLWTLVVGKPPRFLEPTLLCERADGVDRTVAEAVRAGLEPDPYLRLPSVRAFAGALGAGLEPARLESPRVLETIVRSAAGVFHAAAASIALFDRAAGDLVYECSWGPGAEAVVGMRLPLGTGIAGAVLAAGEPEAIPSCRTDPRFARQVAASTGYVPGTMLVVPLRRRSAPFGIVQVLRDGAAFGPGDIERGSAFVNLALATLDADAGETLTGGS
ncbi:protein kinase [Solirubrobacter ginsenosidimutans]|uniref:non-specific serine/threonine protein kinase n=1 Tax=Solirubrobacter ginsenosidimutans TaxID=490573 RepID=A0A9X3S0A5_9ACTN|nr:serine/threonine-protein kinase [Solirubrobacter ginsenosidimutans]MDA0159827.1 protein kinase [Solirubrobacter ginsenosidimutans]